MWLPSEDGSEIPAAVTSMYRTQHTATHLHSGDRRRTTDGGPFSAINSKMSGTNIVKQIEKGLYS